MIEIDIYPDLLHWKTVQEFTIEQAALLLAAIDPLDTSLHEVRNKKHARWKYAWGFAKGMESAIRRGTLTPVVCYGENDVSQWEIDIILIKPTDRTYSISVQHTILTRESMNDWTRKEKVSYFIPRRTIPKVIPPEIKVIEPEPHEIKLLPRVEHRSEGLEYVDEAITQLWATYDEDNPATAPTKEQVMTFLVSKGASGNMAKAIDLILRPSGLRGKGRPIKRKG
ncbi:hypothetical protein M5U04_08985 [Xenorhabdus sp. XENO-1]|nr:hypothetical protein [Xenorhabdus bovienii]MCP9268232.1 hypothetical protein [Xenorhabdus bovienii subsp. africana]